LDKKQLIKELKFTAVRSSGAGGQHVNKISSKIVVRFNVDKSTVLTDEEKELLFKNIVNKLNNNRELIITCEDTRSQHRNKAIAIEKLVLFIKKGLIIPKKPKIIKPCKQANRKRLEKKAKHALKKLNRKKFKDF